VPLHSSELVRLGLAKVKPSSVQKQDPDDDGGDGGDGGGDGSTRGPQSLQSVPKSHMLEPEPSPPSSQKPCLPTPGPKRERGYGLFGQVLVQTEFGVAGGAVGGGEGGKGGGPGGDGGSNGDGGLRGVEHSSRPSENSQYPNSAGQQSRGEEPQVPSGLQHVFCGQTRLVPGPHCPPSTDVSRQASSVRPDAVSFEQRCVISSRASASELAKEGDLQSSCCAADETAKSKPRLDEARELSAPGRSGAE